MNIFLIIVCSYVFLSLVQIILSKKPNVITVYFGVPGCGKTTVAAGLTKKYMRKKELVYSNVPITGALELDICDLGNYMIGGDDKKSSHVIIDEAGVDFNNRNFKTNMPSERLHWFKYHRHYNCSVDVFSQSYEDFDKKIRDLAQQYYVVRRSLIPFFVSCRKIKKRIGICKETGQIIDEYYFPFLLLPGSVKLIFAPSTWKMFNTHSHPILPIKDWNKY